LEAAASIFGGCGNLNMSGEYLGYVWSHVWSHVWSLIEAKVAIIEAAAVYEVV
jgi:hypothetical protein